MEVELSREKYNLFYEKYRTKLYTKNLYGGIFMQMQNTVKVTTGHVITQDGIRMNYQEYIDMIKSERI